MKVLITAATSARAHQLKAGLDDADVILGDYNELPAFIKIIALPNPASDTYTHEMLTLCLDNNVETVYLLSRAEAGVLLKSSQLFYEYNIDLIDATNL